jgi:hypothetical protein
LELAARKSTASGSRPAAVHDPVMTRGEAATA